MKIGISIGAADSTGQTIDSLLTAERDAASAMRFFFRKVFATSANVQPRVINVDKNRAYPVAINELEAEGPLDRAVAFVNAST